MGSLATKANMSPEFLSLLRYCLVLALLVHLPFLGLIIGGSAVSLVVNLLGREKGDPMYKRFSREMIETAMVNKTALFLFGLLPLIPVALIYRLSFIGSDLLPGLFWFGVSGTLLGGFLLLSLYRASLSFRSDMPIISIGSGLLGLVMVVGAFKLLVLGTGIIFNPEKLPFLSRQLLYFLSWNSLVKLMLFLALFFGITGGVILFFIGRKGLVGDPVDSDYRQFAHTIGAGITFAVSIAVPLLILLNIVTLPDVALSQGIFYLSGLTLFLLLIVCLVLYRIYRERSFKPNGVVFVLYIMIFLTLLATDISAMGNAYREQEAALELRLAMKKEKEEKVVGKKETEAVAEDPGESVFTRICSGCHQFEARVVGPPLGEVLPKYAGDPERLQNFIRNPVKVDPDYPPMPKLSIEEEEIEAVAVYLLRRI